MLTWIDYTRISLPHSPPGFSRERELVKEVLIAFRCHLQVYFSSLVQCKQAFMIWVDLFMLMEEPTAFGLSPSPFPV